MKIWTAILVFSLGISCQGWAEDAAMPAPEPPLAAAEELVKSYVDKEFIQEELPPPKECDRYSEKLMFAYDWTVVIHKFGSYDSAQKLLPVEAVITVRCGPMQPASGSAEGGEGAKFPLRSETPIDFQLRLESQEPPQWKVYEVTLWKSKQQVIQE